MFPFVLAVAVTGAKLVPKIVAQLPEEICEHLAVLRHGCEKRGIVVEFAQSGLAWLTPEREARVEREIGRLRQQDASAAA